MRTASSVEQCLEFITQRTKTATIQGHQAECPTTAAQKKTRKKKPSTTHWACDLRLGTLPSQDWTVDGQKFMSHSLLPEAKQTQTE